MKQHEVEALRKIEEELYYMSDKTTSGEAARIAVACSNRLGNYLDSLSISDDSLRELIENLKQHAAKKEKLRNGILWAIGYVEEFFELERLALEEKKQDDDDLREGLEALRAEWEKVIKHKREDGGYEASCIASTLVLVNGEIKKLLAETPAGWKPIAGAPRDGIWFLALREIGDWHSKEYGDRIEKVQYINGCFEDSYERQFMEIEFTHWRPMPAPPREGKE